MGSRETPTLDGPVPLRKLTTLDEAIEARCRATRAAHPDWPCRAGCDRCCRSLPTLPLVTEPEWARVWDALLALPAEARATVLARVRDTAPSPPVVCPLLDRTTGQCVVYGARPVDCRTYGFFTDRDAGLHCDQVTRLAEEPGRGESIVWGNGEAIRAAMRELGEVRPLDAWLAARDELGPED